MARLPAITVHSDSLVFSSSNRVSAGDVSADAKGKPFVVVAFCYVVPAMPSPTPGLDIMAGTDAQCFREPFQGNLEESRRIVVLCHC